MRNVIKTLKSHRETGIYQQETAIEFNKHKVLWKSYRILRLNSRNKIKTMIRNSLSRNRSIKSQRGKNKI